ncbi:HD domain-containing protein [Acinetobacter baumannii]|uniref:HD domain-containing protein n=1 Tax=Acinetobacter baumannii TaxID=470 RepID=A0A3R9RNF7_ACIBA|nr:MULTISPECIES: HD domain-containing protein [Acinetobacter calcoaceticus/baumannii complex]EHU3344432.1 HD domain-containing protein [Acinetobacter baumannii]EKP64797.1 HD domain protein [Acinetobacter baumannii Naval-82]EXE16451.1 HD domain protein [Acinetobacter baumannii 1106579]KQD08663.1 hypothetical protein APD06_16300 [Acinetobacter baumannii]MBK5978899.1 HD domain-containing protein [Acinetobacter baumannii]
MLSQKRIFDPLYGTIHLSEFEYELIQLPEVQRLREVRMCNINSLLITGASQISRFEHSIGVMYLAKVWLENNKKILPYPLKAEDILAAAILHDMQTGPFGHSLQYVLEDNEVEGNFEHQNVHNSKKSKYYQDFDANYKYAGFQFKANIFLEKSWVNISQLIEGTSELGALISGNIDLDNIDNVIRLAYHVGVAKKEDAEIALKLAKDIQVQDKKINISKKSIAIIEAWQKIRQKLYELLLLDWAEFSAKAMLTKAIELAVSQKLIGTDTWIDTDSQFLDRLENLEDKNLEIRDLIKRIKCGDLYEPLYLYKSTSITEYQSINTEEQKLILTHKIHNILKTEFKIGTKVILHFILDKGKTNRAIEIHLRDNQKDITIGNDSKQLLIGIFLSKKNQLNYDIINKIQSRLNLFFADEIGLQGLEPLSDPLPPTIQPEPQLTLNL